MEKIYTNAEAVLKLGISRYQFYRLRNFNVLPAGTVGLGITKKYTNAQIEEMKQIIASVGIKEAK